jgi:hypothetical protein
VELPAIIIVNGMKLELREVPSFDDERVFGQVISVGVEETIRV